MEELPSSDVRIVLNIKEGKGFEQIILPTLVTATLNGHLLETETISPSPNPQYDHDLVWEIDKNRLRKMRSGQVPLKLECFAVKGLDSKEKLGYLLLSLRSAQVFSKNEGDNVKTSWYKLLGLRSDLKIHKPELLLGLSIHDQESTTLNCHIESKNAKEIKQTNFDADKITPILLRDERLIQLGPLDTCHELFLMNIAAITAANTDLLLPEKYYLDMKNNLYFWCKILENHVYFNQSKREYGEFWILNEKIVIRIRTLLKVLKSYLQVKPFLIIYLKYKDNIIAQSEVNLQPLVSTDNIEEFLKTSENNSNILNYRCYLYKKELNENGETECSNSYLDLQLKLQYVGGKTEIIMNTPSTVFSNTVPLNPTKEQTHNLKHINYSEIDYHRNPAGDFGTCNTAIPMVSFSNGCSVLNKHSLSYEHIRSQQIKPVYSQSVDKLPCQCRFNDCSKSVEAYHCYCLNIVLIAIKSVSPKLTVPNIEIQFHHPKTEIASTFHPKISIVIGENVKLQDIGCKLHFISATDEIKHLLSSFPPKISIYKIDEGPKTCIAECVVDVKQLICQSKTECQCEIQLYDKEQSIVGNLDIAMNLEDHGPYYRIKKKTPNENLGPPILDDSLAYKIVDELETWKERQKEIFKVELKRKEDRHLNLLSQEWQKHKESLEAKLACSVKQCKMLANSLNNATEDLRTRRLKSLEKETRLIKANEELHWSYESKLRELRESYHTMQDELMSKISALEKRKTILETQVEELSTERERLQLLATKQAEELKTYQKGSLTQHQTATLLQELKTLEEKLQHAQDSKSFFKSKWATAVREIHRLKQEYQEAIQVQIKNSKEELENLDLEEILCADSTALTNDQTTLNQIQKEIDVIKQKPSYIEIDPYSSVFTPTTMGPRIPQSNSKHLLKQSEEKDERLQALIEERDSLLKTGSYTYEDAIIIKLNAEIRSQMLK
ncbi:PREDICTED: centrosomal protein of 120 kDa-like [Dufourea novaeangliae]|uniref:centrosomal protein of 120 kDa-like n=1 Tax=Dufourea novaeangliae TaxID=178035 RepID=UPI0007672EEB|nr:PREDICTED: centrosomal protein of 120 kDa-like [Dufourea novaeangliae]